MTPLNDTSSIRALLGSRRSASPKAMGEPGPTPGQLMEILSAAVRVPDHGKLTPWRFILFEAEARAKFGDAMKARWRELHPEHGEESFNFQRGMFLRAPVVIAVISTAAPHPKIPEWEQALSAGAVCQTMLMAAAALGVGCAWNTDWMAYDAGMAKVMGLKAQEKVAGFIYLGTPTAPLEDRPRPDPMVLLTRWGQA
ncbi:MAG: nitroreductase [Rhizobiales bacterium]|nr:nitroreductase [Hyphomicrobiales bacterium]